MLTRFRDNRARASDNCGACASALAQAGTLVGRCMHGARRAPTRGTGAATFPSMSERRLRLWLGLFIALLAGCGDDAEADGAAGDDDAGQPPPTGSLAECFADLVAPESRYVELQSFATSDGAIRIQRARQPGSRSAVGETAPYDLVRFGIEREDGVECESRSSQLSYEFGHHNWNEVWEARTARARYSVREELDVARLSDDPTGTATDVWEDTLEIHAADGSRRLLGPLTLVATGCRSLPYDLNPCFRRMRSDQPPAGGEE
jgi:hypothetical protein